MLRPPVFFSAVTILLPSLLLKKRGIIKNDAAIFCFLSSTLTGAKIIHQQFRVMRQRALRIRDGFDKSTFILHNTTRLEFNVQNNDADCITIIGTVMNIFLSVGKKSVGMTCQSSTLIADAAHSISNLFSDLIILWAVQMAAAEVSTGLVVTATEGVADGVDGDGGGDGVGGDGGSGGVEQWCGLYHNHRHRHEYFPVGGEEVGGDDLPVLHSHRRRRTFDLQPLQRLNHPVGRADGGSGGVDGVGGDGDRGGCRRGRW